MKKIICLLVLFASSFLLTACNTMESDKAQHVNTMTRTMGVNYPKEESVKIYSRLPQNQTVTTLGQIHVETHNLFGFRRQTASIRHLMEQQAANMGGNAIVHPMVEKGIVTGDVVIFHNKIA